MHRARHSCILALALVCSPLHGQTVRSKATRVVVSNQGSEALVARLRSELELMGIGVRVTREKPRAEQIVTEDEILVEVQAQRVVIHSKGPNGHESLDVTAHNQATPELIALSAVELLRGRLLHVSRENAPKVLPPEGSEEPADQPRRDTPNGSVTTASINKTPDRSRLSTPETPASRSTASASPGAWSAELGPYLFIPNSEVPMSMGLYAHVGRKIGGSLGVGIRFAGSIGGTSFDIEDGRMEYRLRAAALTARYDFWMLTDRLVLAPELGIGALQALAQSYPNRTGTTVVDVTNFSGATTSRWVLLGMAQLNVDWYPLPYLAVVGAGGASFLVPRVEFEGITKVAGASPVKTSFRHLGYGALVANVGLRVRF